MPHLYPSGFYELQPCFVQSIMSRPHAFVKAGEFSCARRVKILLQSKAAYAIFTTIPGSVRARSDKFIRKTTGASDCGFPQNRRVKGKQVQILCDLVTVIGECETTRFAQSLTDKSVGKAVSCIDPSVRKPAGRLVRGHSPKPRGIGHIVLGAAARSGRALFLSPFTLG